MQDKPHLPKLKQLVNQTATWDAFVAMLDSAIEMHQRKLEQCSEMENVFKAQGAIAALRHLKYLRDEVNGYDKEKDIK